MIIRGEGITKSYGARKILDSIDFYVKDNEWISILGPNGSGKSTLLSCLIGSSKVDYGTIQVFGKDISRYTVKDKAKVIAFLTQESLPDMPNTVEEIIQMGRYAYQQSYMPWYSKKDQEIVEEVMVFTNTIGLRNSQIGLLSGGERQRVSIALALAQEPQILLLDEPTTYLDVYYQLAFFDLLKEWQNKNNTTIISVLHDLNLASLYSDRCFLLHKGKVLDEGKVSDILTTENINKTYQIDPLLIQHPIQKVPQILLKGDFPSTTHR
ncbi:ABC transporter ATP-binding protein [Shimazuella kribbensis]|uniref:ABC transporter ATP-binding protein n=1 Tax=Shimazuella kribbensis TaxID=139808 RepID=UPI000409AFF3|nr:ABC transporter ATP-binding protein [Shimazuella kribbensis]